MKEQIRFVRWLFSGLELWQWLMLVSMLLNVGSLFAIGTEVSSNMNLAGMIILLLVCTKWFMIDPLKVSWTRYKEQRNTLLTTIKDSHK
jgi:dolichyl-phosphate-mannose--protein O-mannosyl transferase